MYIPSTSKLIYLSVLSGSFYAATFRNERIPVMNVYLDTGDKVAVMGCTADTRVQGIYDVV